MTELPTAKHPGPHTLISCWAENAGLALMLVAPNLAAVWCNRAARRLLGRHDAPFTLDRGRMVFEEPTEEAQFRGRLRAVSERLELITVGRRYDRTWLVAAQKLPVEGGLMLVLRPAKDLSAAGALTIADFAGSFRLTQAESAVARRLLSAEAPEDIAKYLRIKVGTVRTHVRNIYIKLDVQSREGLLMRCLPLVWLDG